MGIQDILVVVSSGAFGGLLHAIHFKDGKLSLPGHFVDPIDGTKSIRLGVLSDILLGIGAGIIATTPLGLDSPVKEMYVSIIAGVGGGSFIAKQVKKTESAKKGILKDLPTVATDINELFETGDSYDDPEKIAK